MKIVCIFRHYPPITSGAARRLLGLVTGLREAGAEVFVVAPLLDEGEYGLSVPHPQPEAPNGYDLRTAKTGVKNFLRSWLRIPDPDVKWSKEAAKAFLADKPFTPDWVFTSTPPESSLISGKMIKKATGARWASDFRDLWMIRPHRSIREVPIRRAIETRWAHNTLRSLDCGFAVNEEISDEVSQFTRAPIHVLPHFSLPVDIAPYEFESGFSHIVHTGRFSLSDPNCHIETLLDPFRKAVAANAKLKLHLIGALSDAEQRQVQTSPASDNIVVHGTVPLETSLSFQKGADALALVAALDASVSPSKLTEYIDAKRPIIVCSDNAWRNEVPGQSDTAEALMLAIAAGELQNTTTQPVRTSYEAAQTVIEHLGNKSWCLDETG